MIQSNYLSSVGSPFLGNDGTTLLQNNKLDFGVVERDLYCLGNLESEGFKRITNRKALLRDDDYNFLGITKEKYSVVTMVEALSLLDPLVSEGHLKYESAGAVSNTRGESTKFFVLLSLNTEHYEVTKGDRILPYVLLSNSFDGSSGVWLRSTGIRFCCDNQTHLLIKERTNKLHIKHIGLAKQRFLSKGKQ